MSRDAELTPDELRAIVDAASQPDERHAFAAIDRAFATSLTRHAAATQQMLSLRDDPTKLVDQVVREAARCLDLPTAQGQVSRRLQAVGLGQHVMRAMRQVEALWTAQLDGPARMQLRLERAPGRRRPSMLGSPW
jgi:hypothetical protein